MDRYFLFHPLKLFGVMLSPSYKNNLGHEDLLEKSFCVRRNLSNFNFSTDELIKPSRSEYNKFSNAFSIKSEWLKRESFYIGDQQ